MAEMSYPLNDTLYLAEDAQIWHSTRTQGVFSSENDLLVLALNQMKIRISPGIAWLKKSRFVNAVYANTDELTLDIETADGYFSRYDRVVVRWDFVINKIYLAIKKGIPASVPTPPMPQRDAEAHEIAIFDILVRAGTLQIVQSDVVDRRLDEYLCGIMRDGVTGIPTQALYDAWWSWFDSLKLDAERKSFEFTEWMNLFKLQNESSLREWLSDFKSSNQSDFDVWFNNFTESSIDSYTEFKNEQETDFLSWFNDIKSTLDGDQATNLYNRIEAHEKLTIFGTDGVHGARAIDGRLEIRHPDGWVTYAIANVGQSWEYRDSLDMTWMQKDILNQTWDETDNLMEVS